MSQEKIKKPDENEDRESKILEFLFSALARSLRIKTEKWQKMMSGDEKLVVLAWMNKPEIVRLCFYLNTLTALTPFHHFPTASKGKVCYFLKKNLGQMLMGEDIASQVIVGDMSPKPLIDMTVLLESVYYPIMHNPLNQKTWPEIIKKDVELQVQELKNSISEVKGNISNKTLLPMPTTIDKVFEIKSELAQGNTEALDIKMKNSMEGIIIKWTFQIDQVLKETSASLFDNKSHPTPLAELRFWEARRRNVQNIYDQLRDPRVKQMGQILELINSVYCSTFRATFKNIVTALHEANDITLWLKPLQSHFEYFEANDFMDVEIKILPLYHCICLMWAHTCYYGTNPRMMIFFRMINNMMIEQSVKALDGMTLFHGEPDESFNKLYKVIDILELYRTSFNTYRDKLPEFVLPGKSSILWSFKISDVFDRFDYYMNRLYSIRDIFETANEFWKLQKIEIGGIKGRHLTMQLNDIYMKFQKLYVVWGNITFDPLDPDPSIKEFDKEFKKFRNAADEMERKIATILSQALDECSTMESIIKLYLVAGTLMYRKIVFPEIVEKLHKLIDFYNEDLDTVKSLFNEQMDLFEKHGVTGFKVDRGFPPVAGILYFIRKMRTRLRKPKEELANLDFDFFEGDEGQDVQKKLAEMLSHLDNLEVKIFGEWADSIPEIIATNMQKPLLVRTEKGLLQLNFDDKLVATFKEVKMLNAIEKQGIPETALDFNKLADSLWNSRVMLSRIVEWYNELKEVTVECEFNLIAREVSIIDNKLEYLISKSEWKNYEQSNIDEVHNDIHTLNVRVMKTKRNVEKIIKSMKTWGHTPLYSRKIKTSSISLMTPDDVPRSVLKREDQCITTKALIDELMEENFRLFFNLAVRPRISSRSFKKSVASGDTSKSTGEERPSEVKSHENDKAAQASASMFSIESHSASSLSAFEIDRSGSQQVLFRAYEEYIDDIIGRELIEAIKISIRYIRTEMDGRNKNGPLFNVKLELQEPEMVFIPPLRNSNFSLENIIQNMIIYIYNMVGMIPKIAQPLEEIRDSLGQIVIEDFSSYLENNREIENVKDDIVTRMGRAIDDATKSANELQRYNFLWLYDKQEKLEQFLRYSRILNDKETELVEQDKTAIEEKEPDLDLFRETIDRYGELYDEINKMEVHKVFNEWLSVDMKGFKQSLLNQVCKWSHLFKQYLFEKVINSLKGLEDFIDDSTKTLELEVTNEDYATLLEVLIVLDNISKNEEKYDTMFDPLKDVVDLLASYDVVFDDRVHDQFAELPERWITLKKNSYLVKQEISSVRSYQVDMIKKKIALFDLRSKLYREKFKNLQFFSVPCPNVYEICDKVNDDLVDMERHWNDLKESAALFDLSPPEESRIRLSRREVKMAKQIWDSLNAIESSIEDWKMTPWKKINVEDMEQECKKFTRDLRALDKDLRSWAPYTHAELLIKNLLTSLRAITELQNPAIRERHWVELMYATKVRFEMNDSTTLAELLDLNLHKFEEEVKNIVDKSVKEMGMEKILNDLNNNWKTLEFDTEVHDRTKLKIIRVSEDILECLEENQVQLQNLMSSKYIAYFLKDVTKWQTNLSNADQVITGWMEVQRKWMYLESIFIGSEDIRNQLPVEAKRFENIDRVFKNLLTDMLKDLNVIRSTNKAGLYEILEELLGQLVLCEKALNDYLETKRLAFPRFYFVSSADLLDILSNGNSPELVARHLTKLYDSIAKLIFKNGTKIATGMISKENDEHVNFVQGCDCSGKVEIWLNRVTDSMRSTLRDLFKRAVRAYEEKSRDAWVFDWPAQPALCTTQIWWTAEVNLAFAKMEEGYENSLKDYHKKQILQLNSLIVLLLGELSAGDRQKIMTICTIDVHSRDVVSKLVLQKIESASAFQWMSQLRHRWHEDNVDERNNDCYADICDANFRYDYEYLGNTPRLVITPLTDRCYITLTQSLSLCMGGAPAGPAGTGKTETTKDLGRALGIMVYVFNCSEQMDYKSCGNIYKGLSQTGAWGCFDEFNRISVEVLSVVAVQVKTIQDAIKAEKTEFNFMGENISLVRTVGIFITMNPGYAGRTELPENLKALFRPCAMVVPDFELICEIMLVAEGFQEARDLARKFITLYTLCRELLSKQDHYDWGLRAIKSVLVVAGALRRADRQREEQQVLMRALRDFNLPKIVTADVEIFQGLIGDLFPALIVPRKVSQDFEAIVQQSAVELKLQKEPKFILKVVQLEELFAVRHSVFIVGNAGTGKTQVWKTLYKTYQNQKKKPHYNDLNPKAVTNDELFGIINPATREWKDGLFSVTMRDQANMQSAGPKWIVLDGDIDPMWIESLNTVMDDNKVLTLASNERIALTKDMRLLFEISNLRTATPATVSRAGILYINPEDVGMGPHISSWVSARADQSEKGLLQVLFDRYVPPLIEASKRLKKITPISDMAMVQMTCHLLDCLLTPVNVPPDCPKEWYEIYFVFAVIWGFGSALFHDQMVDWRNEFTKFWHNEFKVVKLPATGTVFSYFIDPATKKFTNWSEMVPSFEMDSEVPLQATLVPTAETTRLRWFMDLLIEKKHPVMLIGGAGSGKSVIMSDKLQHLSDNYAIQNVPFNYYTTSEMLQKVLEKPLEKKAGRNFGPPGNKSMVYFIDDMNMPMVDAYGTVQAHTIIRQFLDYQHWYDRSKLTLKEIHNCQFVAVMNPTAGSFTINPRLQRHFSSFAVSYPTGDALSHIYSSILSQHLENDMNKFTAPVQKMNDSIIQAAMLLHTKMSQVFLPTAVKFHYVFNLRDLANIFQGMLFANGDTCRESQHLIRLWVHEASRVYSDKLVDVHDIEVFKKLARDVVKKTFEQVDETKVFAEPLIYWHYADGLQDSKYLPINNWPVLHKLVMEAQVNYNDQVGALNLVMFEDAMSHVCRISRILELPRGNALLIGVGGSGKQSLARLAAFISNLEVFQIQLRKGYSLADMKTDLSGLYLKAGTKNTPCMHLMTDSQISDESNLVLINDMLASGEIPDLFTDDDVDNIVNAVRNEVKQFGILDSKENCWKFFIEKVRKNLKTVLCFSPVGTSLRVRARKFPAIVNCTCIDWFHEWPQSALESVSKRFLSEVDILSPEITESASVFMAYVLQTVNDMSQVYLQNERRYNYTTPKSFLELIALFKKLLIQKDIEIKENIRRLTDGLIKIADCDRIAAVLREGLKETQELLKVKNEEADVFITKVNKQNDDAQIKRDEVSEEEKNIKIVQENVQAQKKICDEELRAVEPVLDAARDALNTLNKHNLTELKSFGTPPDAVVNVCAAVLILFSKGKIPKDRSWKQCKMMMSKVDDFMNQLQNYDKDHISPEVIKALQPYIDDIEFDPLKVKSKSAAAAGLCAWVINIIKYHEVYLIVGPKQRAQIEAQEQLDQAKEELQVISENLNILEEELRKLHQEMEKAVKDKQKCQDEVDNTNMNIDLAQRLVSGLGSENIRWQNKVTKFQASRVTLPGDVLLLSCFISYAGCFSKRYRIELLENCWIPTLIKIKPEISFTETSDHLQLVCEKVHIAQWNNEGLPYDRVSTENAAILLNSTRWPLMIDPQLQGIKWIKQKYGEQLTVLRLTHKGYLDVIERAIRNGETLLIENIDESVDAVLDPLLGRALIKQGKCIKIGDKEIDYNPDFRLILQTKLANPHYKPEMQAQTTLINFTVTRDGLEEQLLAEVVKEERPDLETKKADLTTQQNKFEITLAELENNLLDRLEKAGENVLDQTLVSNLEKTKKTEKEVTIKSEEAKVTSIAIDEAREQYRTAAERASILYFVLNDLYKINPMYQFSLKAFTVVFKDAIKKSDKSDDIAVRVANLVDSITFQVFMYTSRGLFEKHKLIFMSQMVIQILLQSKEVQQNDLDFLLRFPYTPNLNSPVDFLNNVSWGGISALSNINTFRGLDKEMESAQNVWKKFVSREAPEKEKLPNEWKNKTSLQRLCILRCLRPDRMTYAMTEFVREKLGNKYVEARTPEFDKTYQESSNITPIFFILSPGVDPLKDVEKIGKKLKFSVDYGNFHNISLGQGQESVAENAIDIAAEQGHWVILQNIHLVAKWLSTLEKKMEATLEGAHENYRLYISAEPTEDPEFHIIPQGILESAIKITNEPPSGMLANMHKALDNFKQETFERSGKQTEFKGILFGLCFFHAVVAERRKFGPQGWNKSYPFNVGDLTISVDVLVRYLEANNKVPWEDLRYLFGEIMYGGHITDDWDRRLCRTYLEEIMQHDLVDGELEICPGFISPPNSDYAEYHKYIDDCMPTESPALYGLHPNAEIGFLTTLADQLFRTIFELQPRDSGNMGGGITITREDVVKGLIEDFTDKLPEEFIMQDLMARTEEKTPFIVVALQECERMNLLIRELKKSLNELSSGLKGELTMSSDMEVLEASIFFDKVPESWMKRAYPSLLGLQSWFADLTVRCKELEAWVQDFSLPASVWLPGFFNPQSFLTAIMQQTARKNEWALDRMCLYFDVTKKFRDDIQQAPKEGAQIHGLFMEGAKWSQTLNCITSSDPKELFAPMPVIFIRAIKQESQDLRNMYECPLYKTRARGPTFVWTFNLRTSVKPAKWTLGGVCLLLQN